jgi:hypothetical protein
VEQFKALSEVTQPDERHSLLDAVTGTQFSLEGLHQDLSMLSLSSATPEEIKSQFNVARNLAIYTWYSYSLDLVVQLKSYMLIEQSLDICDGRKKREFKKLLKSAVSERWIVDAGFRHVHSTPGDEQAYCKKLVEMLPRLRNAAAHGSNDLHQNAVLSLAISADFINQLFRAEGPG